MALELPIKLKEHFDLGKKIFSKDVVSLYEYIFLTIKCGDLPRPAWKKGKDLPEELQDTLFNHLPDKSRPALYCFEIIEGGPAKSKILAAYKELKDKMIENYEDRRASAALKKNPPLDTNILYVGKVKKDLCGRMTVHLGYYHNPNTSGLQLFCWTKQIDLKLKLHIFSFDQEMSPFISGFELPLAQSLNPMIGKQ